MFGKKSKVKSTRIDTLVGKNTTVHGNISYSGGLHIEGKVVGNIDAEPGEDNVLIVSESGRVKGHVQGPIIILNGQVDGDVKSSASLELASKAKVRGDVYYKLLEMEVGAEVNGSLIHKSNPQAPKNTAAGAKNGTSGTAADAQSKASIPPATAK